MNKRNLLKGILGAPLAARAASEQMQLEARYPSAPPPSYTGGLTKIYPTDTPLNRLLEDPLREAKQLFINKARDAAEEEVAKLAKAETRLQRLKSVSPAFVEFQIEKLRNEREDIWLRFEKLQNGIWGWDKAEGQASQARY